LDVPQLLQPISSNKLKDDEKYGKKKGNHKRGIGPDHGKNFSATRNILNTKYPFPTAPASRSSSFTYSAARIALLFTGPIGPLLSNIHRNRHLFRSRPLFSCQPGHTNQRPTALQDYKRPIVDEDGCIARETGPKEVEKDINFAPLGQISKEIQEKGSQQNGDTDATYDA
jgi:hypothetical protein